MHKKNIFSDFLFILLVLFFLFALFSLNLYFREPNLYGGQIFLIQFTAPWQLLAYIILIIILVLTLEMVLKKITKQSKRENISLNFIFICVFAFLFKLVLYRFSLSYGDASETIKEVFVNGEFNDYKLYNYMIYYISKLTTEYNVYLFLINILLGSLSIGLLFLIKNSTAPRLHPNTCADFSIHCSNSGIFSHKSLFSLINLSMSGSIISIL